jgi:virginiamycin B lyase
MTEALKPDDKIMTVNRAAPAGPILKILVLSLVGIALPAGSASAQQRWLGMEEHALQTNGQVTEFALPTPGSGPSTVAVAPDGTIWFTQSSGNRIGRMAPDGSNLTEFELPTPDSGPRVMSLGADGNMWFSQHTGNRIGRITPDGQITEFPIATPDSRPRAVALGADGNIWFGMFGAGKIGRITPAGEITEFSLPTPDSGPRAVAAGPDGNIWFSQFNVDQIGRITPAGEVTEFPLPHPNSGPGDITAGADGRMWFIQLNGSIDGRNVTGNRVARITMDGEIEEFQIPSPAGTPINIAVGPDRNIWYTKGDSVGQVMADGRITELPISSGGRAVGLSAGSDRQPPQRLTNRLWIALSAGNSLAYLDFE